MYASASEPVAGKGLAKGIRGILWGPTWARPHEGVTKVAQEPATYVVALTFAPATPAPSSTYVERAMGLEPTTFSLGS